MKNLITQIDEIIEEEETENMNFEAIKKNNKNKQKPQKEKIKKSQHIKNEKFV